MAELDEGGGALPLLTVAEQLHDLMISRATGVQSPGDARAYRHLRARLLHGCAPDVLPPLIVRCRSLDHFWPVIKERADTYAERRRIIWDEFARVLDALAATPSALPAELSVPVDSAFVREAWTRMVERQSSDPAGAITAARTLVETVCKEVLEALGEDVPEGGDLSRLYGQAARALNLAPDGFSEQPFRQILGGCRAAVDGLASLRNALGDAHGKGRQGARPAPRHAELAVNLAGTMTLFMLATLEARREAS